MKEIWTIVGVGLVLAGLILNGQWRTGSQIDALRSDVGSQIDALRSDVGSQIDALRSDVGSQIDALRADVGDLQQRMVAVELRLGRIEAIVERVHPPYVADADE